MRRYVFVPAFIAALASALAASPALARQNHTVEGRVVERSTGAAIQGAGIALGTRAAATTDAEGRFVFTDVPGGRYLLEVRGFGYAPEEIALFVRGDTALVIELDPAPLPLDSLEARARRITIRGVVVDTALDLRLSSIEVTASPDHTTTTNLVGRFQFRGMPALTPVAVEVRAFGYLPAAVIVEAERDTTLTFALAEDPVTARLIGAYKARIEDRTSERRSAATPVIDRAEIVRNTNRSLHEVLRYYMRTRTNRITCFVVDERPLSEWRFQTLLPDEVEHIEIVQYGFTRDDLMVRVYTREFFRQLILRGEELADAGELSDWLRTGICQ